MFKREGARLGLFLAWTALALAALFMRALWPVDETRYVAVAWEMWQRGDFLVPYLHGAPYSHKPPLLFWLMHAGWWLFGVNDWWPRLLAPLLALLSALLLLRLARRLWPAAPGIAEQALWIYSGAFLFGALFTLVGFDGLLACSTLLGILGVLQLAQGERWRGCLCLALGIGVGVLAKGPVILLQVLPVALLGPWWSPDARRAMAAWYGWVLGALVLGAGLALCWAIPAAIGGGAAYREAIFWGQTAGRVTASFAHRAPVWWYLPLLPLMLFPWLWWPSCWRGLNALRRQPSAQSRFLLAWLLPVFVGFSLVSGKQARYLLPLLPGFALLAAEALSRVAPAARRWEMLGPALPLGALSGAWIYLVLHPQRLGILGTTPLPYWPAGLFLGAGLVLWFAGNGTLQQRVRCLSAVMPILFLGLYGSVLTRVNEAYDPRSIAQALADLQARGIAVAYLGKYQAQFDFYGRLQPMPEVGNVEDWRKQNPQGRLVLFAKQAAPGQPRPEFERRYRGGYLQIWRGQDVPHALAQIQPSQNAAADTE